MPGHTCCACNILFDFRIQKVQIAEQHQFLMIRRDCSHTRNSKQIRVRLTQPKNLLYPHSHRTTPIMELSIDLNSEALLIDMTIGTSTLFAVIVLVVLFGGPECGSLDYLCGNIKSSLLQFLDESR